MYHHAPSRPPDVFGSLPTALLLTGPDELAAGAATVAEYGRKAVKGGSDFFQKGIAAASSILAGTVGESDGPTGGAGLPVIDLTKPNQKFLSYLECSTAYADHPAPLTPIRSRTRSPGQCATGTNSDSTQETVDWKARFLNTEECRVRYTQASEPFRYTQFGVPESLQKARCSCGYEPLIHMNSNVDIRRHLDSSVGYWVAEKGGKRYYTRSGCRRFPSLDNPKPPLDRTATGMSMEGEDVDKEEGWTRELTDSELEDDDEFVDISGPSAADGPPRTRQYEKDSMSEGPETESDAEDEPFKPDELPIMESFTPQIRPLVMRAAEGHSPSPSGRTVTIENVSAPSHVTVNDSWSLDELPEVPSATRYTVPSPGTDFRTRTDSTPKQTREDRSIPPSRMRKMSDGESASPAGSNKAVTDTYHPGRTTTRVQDKKKLPKWVQAAATPASPPDTVDTAQPTSHRFRESSAETARPETTVATRLDRTSVQKPKWMIAAARTDGKNA